MEPKQVKDLLEAYASIYSNISESHFKVGDEVICKASGMEGEVIKLDKAHGEDDEKYYTVKREDGKTMKYSADELKLAEEDEEKEEDKEEKEDVKEAKNGGASKKSESKFHMKLDKLVHGTFGASPEEKKMKKEEEDCVPKSEKNKHNCAKKVCHEEFGEGTCIFGQHAEPDRYGYVSHYDVLFEHGVEKGIPTSEMEVLVSESHGAHMKKK